MISELTLASGLGGTVIERLDIGNGARCRMLIAIVEKLECSGGKLCSEEN